MKRILILLFAFCCLLSACGKKEETNIYNYIQSLDNLDNYVILGIYKGVEVQTIKVTDDDIELKKKEIQEKNSYYKKLDKDTVEPGDHVHISFITYLDGEAFKGGKGSDDIQVGDGKYAYPAVETGLIGMKLGNTKSISVTLPDDYYSQGLRGKTVQMNVTVEQIQEKEKTLPEITAEFVKEKYKLDSIDAFEKKLRADLEKEAEDKMYANAWKAALARCEMIEYPDGIIEKYVKAMEDHYTELAATYGADIEYIVGDYDEWKVEATEYAEAYYKSEIVMYSILDREFGREVSDKEYNERIKGYAEDEDITVEELKKKYSKDELITSMHWDKVMEFVWENRAQ